MSIIGKQNESVCKKSMGFEEEEETSSSQNNYNVSETCISPACNNQRSQRKQPSVASASQCEERETEYEDYSQELLVADDEYIIYTTSPSSPPAAASTSPPSPPKKKACSSGGGGGSSSEKETPEEEEEVLKTKIKRNDVLRVSDMMRPWQSHEEPKLSECETELKILTDRWIAINTVVTREGEIFIPTSDDVPTEELQKQAKELCWTRKRRAMVISPAADAVLNGKRKTTAAAAKRLKMDMAKKEQEGEEKDAVSIADNFLDFASDTASKKKYTPECFVDRNRRHSIYIGLTEENEKTGLQYEGIIFTRYHEPHVGPSAKDYSYLHPISCLEETILKLHYLNYLQGGAPIVVPNYESCGAENKDRLFSCNADGSLNFAVSFGKYLHEGDHKSLPSEECYVGIRHSLRLGMTRTRKMDYAGIIFTRYHNQKDFPDNEKDSEYVHPLWTLENTVRVLHYLNFLKGRPQIVLPDYASQQLEQQKK